MTNSNLLYCATDKEIYDALMSAKQRINEKIVLELAKDRGIFLSSKDSRDELISVVSLLLHDYHDLNMLLEQREHAGRTEKLTSVTLNASLTSEEIREVLKEYTNEPQTDERVNFHTKGTDKVLLNVNYSEIDYGKTRLVQRTPKEAGIEFHIESDKTVVRMPANERVYAMFSKLKDKLDGRKKTDIPEVRIEISEFTLPELRTEFFTSLISTMNNFKLENVTSVKVERLSNYEGDEEFQLEDDQNAEEAKQEALAMVKNVALKGETLLASEEYQSFIKKGFFITSIIWRSRPAKPPYHLVEFEAAFDEPANGKGFKYFVRGAYKMVNNHYTKTIRPVEIDDREKYLTLIEEAAAQTITKLREKARNLTQPDSTEGIS